MQDVIYAERPLHPKEKVLEQALQWCKMADPSSAYLMVKKVPRGEAIDIFTGENTFISLDEFVSFSGISLSQKFS